MNKDKIVWNKNKIINKVLEIFSSELAKYPILTWKADYSCKENDEIDIIVHIFSSTNSFFAKKEVSVYLASYDDGVYFSLDAYVFVNPKKNSEEDEDTKNIRIHLYPSSQNRFFTKRYSYAKEKILQFLREVLNYRRSDEDEWFEMNYYSELTKRLINKFTSELDEIDKEIYEGLYEVIDEVIRKKDEDITQKKQYYILKYLLTQTNLKEDIVKIKKKIYEAIVLSKI